MANTATRYNGAAHDGTPVTAVYLASPQDDAALGLAFVGDDLPRIVHWGHPLAAPETLVDAVDALRPQRVSGALDFTPWPSVLPTQAESWIGEPRIVLRRGHTELYPKFAVTGVELSGSEGVSGSDGLFRAAGTIDPTVDYDPVAGSEDVADVTGCTRTTGPSPVPGVIVHAEDATLGIGLEWHAQIVPGGLVRQRAAVRNLFGADRDPLEVGKIELGFPVPATATELLTTTGHHLRERSPQRQPLIVGRFAKPQLAGRPDFDASLLLTAGVPGFDFTHGEAYAVHVAWSGNSVLSAERLPYTTGVIGGGEVLSGGEITLSGASETSKWYETPWVYGSFGDGLNAIARRFHEYVRSRHPRLFSHGRPVILNTWEAVYFNHDFDTLRALADKAAASGVERFVVDDGWFGSRRDDTSGLGDWWIAQDVWPDGPESLKALADYVHGLGLQFGLWFEPEMINPDSDTAHAHPDWILAPAPGRLPMQGRSQQVLDLTNPNAFAYIFGCMDALVGELGIDYIKWDHNKLVTEAVSPLSGRPAVHAQTLAVYRIFRDLIRNHPGLEIESCSSGGGRVDLGILEYASRIWASDCVDPVERADIQRYTSLLVPPAMIGEHVGASPAHSTHRATSQELRMAMAFFGHMGIEWNLLKEPSAALEELAVWVAEFKKHRDWFAIDTVVHGDGADPAVRLDGMVMPSRDAAIYRFTQLTTGQTYPAAPVRLPGLDPTRVYRVSPLDPCLDLLDPANPAGVANGQSALGWWTPDGVLMTGEALERYGLRPPSLHPAQAVLFKVVAVVAG